MSLKAVVFCACVAIAALASASAKPSTSVITGKGKVEGCDFGGQFIAVGASAPAKDSCTEYTCVAPGSITARGCPSEAIPPELQKKCHFEEHKEKPYPGCCPKAVCNE